ncbi:hypothetical protein ACSBR2_002140 [Camellia fascicularis]
MQIWDGRRDMNDEMGGEGRACCRRWLREGWGSRSRLERMKKKTMKMGFRLIEEETMKMKGTIVI